MSDFEVHPLGTNKEIKLSRELANVIAKQMQSQSLPEDIVKAYNALQAHYNYQIEMEYL